MSLFIIDIHHECTSGYGTATHATIKYLLLCYFQLNYIFSNNLILQ